MKKFIAIILVVMTVFSTLTMGASAFTMDNDGVKIGVDNDVVYADPGATITLPIGVAAKLNDETLAEANVDKASAVLVIPFSLETNDMSPMQSVALADAAKAAGVTFEQKETVNGVITGEIKVPVSALNGNESLVVLNVEVKMDENWEVQDYKAVNPVLVKPCEKYLSAGVKVIDKDQNSVTVSIMPTDFQIKATPYKANFIEKAIEWVKSKIRGILVLFQTLNTYLLSDPLEAPDWVKQEENRAARDAKEAQQLVDVA